MHEKFWNFTFFIKASWEAALTQLNDLTKDFARLEMEADRLREIVEPDNVNNFFLPHFFSMKNILVRMHFRSIQQSLLKLHSLKYQELK